MVYKKVGQLSYVLDWLQQAVVERNLRFKRHSRALEQSTRRVPQYDAHLRAPSDTIDPTKDLI